MSISPKNIIPLTKARAKLTELCEQIQREHIHLALIEEALRGAEDVSAGKTFSLKKLKALYGR